MRGLRRLLGLDAGSAAGGADTDTDTETVARIAAELEQLPRDEARFLAAFAYVLARVAGADLDVSAEETREMVERVQQLGELSEAQATLVVTIAKSQAITLGGTENYVVTRQFRELSTRAQRISLLRCLFAVAAADESISSVENDEITAIGTELGFGREEIAGVRGAYRDRLEVLKGAPGSS